MPRMIANLLSLEEFKQRENLGEQPSAIYGITYQVGD